jgi:hypothetical protein
MPRWTGPTFQERDNAAKRLRALVEAECRTRNDMILPGDKPVVGLGDVVSVVLEVRPDITTLAGAYPVAHRILDGYAVMVNGVKGTMASSGGWAAKVLIPAEAQAARAAIPHDQHVEWGRLGGRPRRS